MSFIRFDSYTMLNFKLPDIKHDGCVRFLKVGQLLCEGVVYCGLAENNFYINITITLFRFLFAQCGTPVTHCNKFTYYY